MATTATTRGVWETAVTPTLFLAFELGVNTCNYRLTVT